MSLSILAGSFDDNLDNRIDLNELNLSGVGGALERLTALESDHSGISVAFLGAPLDENINGSINGADLSTTNIRVNAIQSAIEAHGISATS